MMMIILVRSSKLLLIKRLKYTVPSNKHGCSSLQNRKRIVVAVSTVASEADQESLKHQVEACEPIEAAAAVETAMFDKKKLKDQKKKIGSILFNLTDPKNPDLRRKALLGEVKPERLMSMSNTEMASEELQLRIKQINEEPWSDARLVNHRHKRRPRRISLDAAVGAEEDGLPSDADKEC